MLNYFKYLTLTFAVILAIDLGGGCTTQQLSDYQMPKDPETLKGFQRILLLVKEYNETVKTSQEKPDVSKLIGSDGPEDWSRIVKLVEEHNEKIKSSENENGTEDPIGPDSVKEFQKFWQETIRACHSGEAPKWEIDYQKETDPIRVEDVHTIAQLVEDFYEKKGYYPLADSKFKLPLTVTISIKKYEDSPPNPVPIEVFDKELKSVLGENVMLPMDPQTVDVWGGPRLYQYFTTGKHYFVSTNLFFPKLGARYLMPYAYKYEVGSCTNAEQKAFKFSHIKEGRKSVGLAYDYEDMALVHLGKGEFDEAQKLFNEALEIYKLLGKHINKAYIYAWFAEINCHKNKFDDAEKMSFKSLEILERYNGQKKKMAENFTTLGMIYCRKGNKEKAKKFWAEASDLYMKAGMSKEAKTIQEYIDNLSK